MNRSRIRWSARLVLLGILGGLLAYAWATDRPSPAYPHGQFGERVLFALATAGLVGTVVLVVRAMKR